MMQGRAELSSSLRIFIVVFINLYVLHMHCICFAKIFLTLDSFSSKRLKKIVADVKGKDKHSISFAYALLTHFTVLAVITRRSDRIAAKISEC
jgi:hypothetical protein